MKDIVTFEPIGYTRSNILVKVPVNTHYSGLEVFLNTFPIDDLVDIFCMIEFIIAIKYRKNKALRKSLGLLNDLLYDLKSETYFGELLKNDNLDLALKRVEMGKTLVLPGFHT